MKNLCIIPARGGSKRIPRKNVKSFLGKPMLAYSIEAAMATNLFDEFQNILEFGIPVKQAIKSVTINPARVIGADKITGSIEDGKNADLLVLSEDMKTIKAVFVKGKRII